MREKLEEEIAEDYEEFDEVAEEWPEEEDSPELLTETDIVDIKAEIADLRGFRDLAVSISENAKGQALLSALRVGFAKAIELGGPEKAIIFTESRRTQEYSSGFCPRTATTASSSCSTARIRTRNLKRFIRRGSSATKAPTASPARGPPTCARRSSITSAKQPRS